ncbi:transposase [Rickettsia bellii]|uniref:Transposase IS116/IS110/IS902 family protein n=1 Tax=Rickettsia bellii str. RML An4 TaxID=1359193 RepID=A0A0F3QE93_RICBE|nr:IS110 family transposase [Rickettsia bellii]ARD86040.1 transposase [Rickettsia bellii]KJV90486.1 transposase IS116/IS110/IS902 family protein [Rickettsia bellii str. RML An4]
MIKYHKHIGIDIGKYNFVVGIEGIKDTKEYENTSSGIFEFINDNKDILANSLTVVETTGGYELELLYSLCERGYVVHRADARKVKNFIRSYGNSTKTDKLDAKALGLYGKERADKLEVFKPESKQNIQLFRLVQRRNDLKQMLVAEKNRLQQANTDKFVKNSCINMIDVLSNQITEITNQVEVIISSDQLLKAKHEILKEINGIGNIVAFELLILLPELGKLTRRQIASLAGLAPKANDSGKYQGYRKVGHGRAGVKPILFLAAMSARNSKTSGLRLFYERLINNGKKKMVALTALMRKIIVIANAKLKSLLFNLKHS